MLFNMRLVKLVRIPSQSLKLISFPYRYYHFPYMWHLSFNHSFSQLINVELFELKKSGEINIQHIWIKRKFDTKFNPNKLLVISGQGSIKISLGGLWRYNGWNYNNKFTDNGEVCKLKTSKSNLPRNGANGFAGYYQSSLAELALTGFKTFDYERAEGKIDMMNRDGEIGLDLRGPTGSRVFRFYLHDWRKKKDAANKKEVLSSNP